VSPSYGTISSTSLAIAAMNAPAFDGSTISRPWASVPRPKPTGHGDHRSPVGWVALISCALAESERIDT
jgi:hypothetical protein